MTARIIVIGKNSTMPRLTGPNYDATAERWVTPPSGMTPDAGAAADLQHSGEDNTLFSATTRPQVPVARPLEATGHWQAAADIFTTALGLLVFGLIAAAFLVMT
jgi:hypothetical protein